MPNRRVSWRRREGARHRLPGAMKAYQAYLLRVMAPALFGTMFLAVGVFLLERLLKVFEVVSTANETAAPAARMLLGLVPYALSLALPVGLFLAVLLTVDRIGRSGELAALQGAGVSLFQIHLPMVLVGTALGLLTLLNDGYLQPLGRYDYRATLHSLEQTTFEAAFQEGKFAGIGSRVFWTEDRRAGSRLGQVFILEEDRLDRTARLTTAPSGSIRPGPDDNETQITLNRGEGIVISPENTLVERLQFEQADWRVTGEVLAYRPRGEEVRELLLHELMILGAAGGDGPVGREVAAAAFHNRVGRSLLLVVLPFLAVVLGLGQGRSVQSGAVAVGIGLLVLIQKLLESGEAWAASGAIAPWMGTWPVIAGVALVSFGLFVRTERSRRPR